MSDGISGFGVTLSGASTGSIAQIIGLEIPGMEADDIDVSSGESTGRWREYIAGMKDAGELSLDLLYEEDNFDAIQDSFAGDSEVWTVTLPDGATFVCSGYIKSNGIAVPMDDKVSQSATLKLSGVPVYTAVSGS